MFRRSRFCFVLFMVCLVGLTVPARTVSASGGPIAAATTGVSCKTGHRNWGVYGGTTQTRPANATTAEFVVRCFFNPPNTTAGNNFMSNLGTWDGNTDRPFVEVCGTTCGSTPPAGSASFSTLITDSLKMCQWGTLRRADGTVTRTAGSLSPACGAAGPGSPPDNYAEFVYEGPWPAGVGTLAAGANVYDSGGVGGSIFSFCFTDGSCNSQTQVGGTVMPQVRAASGSTNAPAYGLSGAGLSWWVSGHPDAYPDTFEGGGSFPDAACDGIDFSLRENGTALTLPMGDGDETKTYVLRVTGIPTSGDAETFTFYFDGDAGGDTVAPTFLGSVSAPASSATKDFNVTGIIGALEDPTPDLSAAQAQCRTSRVVGALYWNGDTGLSFTLPDLEQLEPSEDEATLAGCFTFEGMSLTSPVSWVRGIGSMGWCLLRVAVVPDGEDLASTFDEFNAALEEQFPFSLLYMLVDFGDKLGDELSDASGTGCFDMPASFSFGSFSTPLADVCIGDDLTVSGTQRQLLAALMIAPLLWSLCAHAVRMVRGV